jgi:hypothetical protein
MAKDFRANQIRTSVVVGSGSTTWNKPGLGLLIYSSSKATDFDGGANLTLMLADVGTDVSMFISGSANTGMTRAPGSSVLFGGDVVVSGTLWAERSVIEVDDTVAGDFKAPKKIIAGHQTDASGFARLLVDPDTPTGGANRTGTVSLNIVQGTAGGVYTYPTTTNKDVFFHISGSKGVQGTNDRGVTLFDGDVFMSGNLALSPSSVFTLPAIDALTGSDGTPWIAHSGSGNVGVQGWFQVHGNEIKDNAANTVLSFDGSGNLNNDIEIQKSDPQLTLDGATSTAKIIFEGGGSGLIHHVGVDTDDQVKIGLGSALGSTNAIVINTDQDITTGRDLTITRNLTINGSSISDSSSAEVLHLSGSGDATFNKNVTIVGDLMVSGSTVSIGVENLRVEDPVILMGSGTLSSNSNGGIAIASGSSVADQALTFGKGNATNSWRAGRKDVEDGNVDTLIDSVPVVIEVAGLSFPAAGAGATLNITGSADGSATHMTMSNDDGDIEINASQKINLVNSQGVWLPNSTPLNFGSGGSSLIIGDGDFLRLRHHPNSAIQLGVIGNSQTALEFSPGSGMRLMTTSSASAISEINKMFISGGHYTSLYADAEVVVGSDFYTSTLVLSASSNEAVGAPVIILSSSAEYTGGTGREGFISIGANESTVDELFSISQYRDVRTLLSGSTNTIGTNTRGVTLVSGDFVTSGSAAIGGDTSVGGTLSAGAIDIQNLELSAANPYIQFNNSTYKIFKDASNLKFQDNITGPVTLADLNSLSVVDNTNVFTVLEGEPSYVKTSGSFSFDTGVLPAGPPRHTTTIGDNVYFFVSGSVGSGFTDAVPGNGERGTAVFEGDVHISGTMYAERPFFISSLDTAYSTAQSGSPYDSLAPGSGAIINTYSTYPPVQIKGSTNAKVVLGISGSLDFVTGSTDTGDSRIKMISPNAALGFHNSHGEVFKLLPGVGSTTNARFSANNELQFGSDSTRYIRGLDTGGKKRLELVNTQASGIIDVKPGGYMSVTGSILPGGDDIYDLGSAAQRWANVYTGDLHLRNDRGNWTIYEEPDMLVVVNNLTGKKYKMGLTPLEDEE